MKTGISRWRTAAVCLAVAALLLLVCSKSSPLYPINDWVDANIFFTMGKAMMNGQVLYRDVFDHKGPLLYLLYGLGWLVSHRSFLGVFLLEVVSLAAFLAACLRCAEWLTGPLHPAWVALPGLLVVSCGAFVHGGSAEQLCLPLLAWGLPAALSLPKRGRPLPLRAVAVQGMLAGCVLWIKYTMLGFAIGWAAVVALYYLRQKWLRPLWQSMAAYLAGMALATLPWVLYFGWHGALGDWFGVYFGDNLFLYADRTGGGNGFLGLAQRLWWFTHDNPLVALALVLAALWCLVARRFWALAVLGATGLGLTLTALGGQSYLLYYGLPFAALLPFALAPFGGKTRPAAWLLLPAALAFAVWRCPNTAQLLRPAAETPQHRFAAQITQTPGAVLLNYGTLDGGFYTASGALPPCRFFCVTNMPIPQQNAEQDALLAAGGADYVVTLDAALAERYPAYELLDQAANTNSEGTLTWYLYRLALLG